jgi:hypothetical protein
MRPIRELVSLSEILPRPERKRGHRLGWRSTGVGGLAAVAAQEHRLACYPSRIAHGEVPERSNGRSDDAGGLDGLSEH